MILASTFRTEFDIVIDELQTAHFEDEQLESFINQAQDHWFAQWTKPLVIEGEFRPNMKSGNAFIEKAIAPFRARVTGSSDNDGVISTNIQSSWGRDLHAVFMVGAIADTNQTRAKQEIRFRTAGENRIQQGLEFFEPSVSNLYYEIQDGQIQIYPKVKVDYEADFLYPPQNIVVATPTNSLFDSRFLYYIVYKAAELASISVRDYAFAQAMAAKINEL